MNDIITPSVLLSETHFAYRMAKGVVADAVARVAEQGFYRSVEIADVGDAGDRKRIGGIVRGNDLSLTQWMSMLLVTEGLNLSSTDEALRSKSVARVNEHIEHAVECGASSIAVLSGSDPGPALRAEATEQLCVSLCEMCEALAPTKIRLVLEPLDRDAHKNGLIGPTSEFLEIARRVRHSYPEFGVSWDSAHVALCGDDVFESLAESFPWVSQVHLANAILDRKMPGFGDNHMPLGMPGFFGIDEMARLFRLIVDHAASIGNKLPVAVEIRTPGGADPWTTEALGRRAMQEAWQMVEIGESCR